MKCPSCGNEVPEGKKFCGFCGEKLSLDGSAPLTQDQLEKPLDVVNKIQEGEVDHIKDEPVGEPQRKIDRKFSQEGSSTTSMWVEEKPKRKKKRLFLVILIPVAVIALIVTVVLLWTRMTNKLFANLVSYEPEEPASVEVLVNCEDSLGEEVNFVTSVGSNQAVILIYGWLALTKEQVQDYIDHVAHSVYLDGELVATPKMGPIEIFMDDWPPGYPDVEESYAVYWRWDVGQLSPGSHRVSFTQYFTGDVFDGFDTYSAGDQWESGCDIIVE
jgi:hypothetical protein